MRLDANEDIFLIADLFFRCGMSEIDFWVDQSFLPIDRLDRSAEAARTILIEPVPIVSFNVTDLLRGGEQ